MVVSLRCTRLTRLQPGPAQAWIPGSGDTEILMIRAEEDLVRLILLHCLTALPPYNGNGNGMAWHGMARHEQKRWLVNVVICTQ